MLNIKKLLAKFLFFSLIITVQHLNSICLASPAKFSKSSYQNTLVISQKDFENTKLENTEITINSWDKFWKNISTKQKQKFAHKNTLKILTQEKIDDLLMNQRTTRANITNIEIEEGLDIIADRTFSEFISLRSIKIQKTVCAIDDLAFLSCMSLESIEIPKNIVYIGNEVFLNCYRLQSVYLKGDLTKKSIGNFIFDKCQKLEKLIICKGNDLKTITDKSSGLTLESILREQIGHYDFTFYKFVPENPLNFKIEYK